MPCEYERPQTTITIVGRRICGFVCAGWTGGKGTSGQADKRTRRGPDKEETRHKRGEGEGGDRNRLVVVLMVLDRRRRRIGEEEEEEGEDVDVGRAEQSKEQSKEQRVEQRAKSRK